MNKKIMILTIVVILACAVLFVGCVATASDYAPTQPVSADITLAADYALADTGNDIVVAYSDFVAGGSAPSTPGRVSTAAEFVYMMRDTGSTSYTLANDFYVTALMWEVLSDYTTQRMIDINGAYTETVTRDGVEVVLDKKHRITYAPNIDNDTAILSTSAYGGLFAQYAGTMRNVSYRFAGKMEVNVSKLSTKVIYYGGLAGKLNGAAFSNCEIVQNGVISCYANTTDATIYAGGITAWLDGVNISDCTIVSSGTVNTATYMDNGDSVSSSRKCKLYAGGLAALCLNNATISNSKLTLGGSALTSDSAVEDDKSYNDDSYVLPAGGMFALGGSLNMSTCDIIISTRVNSSGSQYTAKNGVIAGGMFGLAGTYPTGTGTSDSALRVYSNVITLSSTISGVTSREHKDSSFFGLIGEDAEGGSVYSGGIVGRFTKALDHNSTFKDNAILYYATITESAKYDPTDGHSYYGYLSGNMPSVFQEWNDGNIWTVLTGDEETTNINVRQSSNNDGSESNSCGDIGVLMVFGGGNVKAEIENGKLQFAANQQYSPFKDWYANLTSPLPYTRSAAYRTGEVNSEQKTDVYGNPYTKYIFRPQTGSKTVFAVFLTEEIKDAGSFVQWTEEMNSGLNKPWIVANVTDDITVVRGVNIVNDFYGKFYGNGHTITFQNSVEMSAVANLTTAEMNTYFGTAEGDDTTLTAAVAGIFRVVQTGAVVTNFDLVFAGRMYGGTYANDAVESYVAAGFLAGINMGTISHVNLTVPQAGQLLAVAKTKAIGGGLVGVDSGNVANITASIQGNYSVKAAGPELGGVIGRCNSNTTKTYANFNVDVKGQLEGYINAASGTTSIVGGLVGYNAASSGLALQDVIVNVHDKSNMGGDVLVNNCIHNIQNYGDMMEEIEEFKVASSTIEDLRLISSYANDLGVASVSTEALAELRSLLSTAESQMTAGTLTQKWFDQNVKALASTLDCNAPCDSCKEKGKRAYFVAGSAGNFGLTRVWAIGSYKQYPGDDSFGVGTNYITYFGTAQTLQQAIDAKLNMIFVRNGTAEGSFEGGAYRFIVPLEDSAHVFTGWYVDYNHTVMVDNKYLSGSAFTPGDQAGSVWYSRVINSMITTNDELDVLASTTNAGQTYNEVTFTLGCDVVASANFKPIGTEAHPFQGTFDGKGYSVSVNGFNASYDAIGLFGCLGTSGTVKQLTVKVRTSGNLNGKTWGGIVGVNYGVVGQDSQNERVKTEIYCYVDGALVAGGIVGKNMTGALVQNTETVFVGTQVGGSTYQGVLRANYSNASATAIAGGAVGHNTGVVRNCKVTCNIADIDEYEFSVAASNNSGAAYAGGLVGLNDAQLYSGVVEVFWDEDRFYIASARGAIVAYSAILVGFNNSDNIDSLWAVYQLDTQGFVTPAANPLINGKGNASGNRMVRYGYGNLSTEIYANTDTQQKGGNIQFAASVDKAYDVPFYSYTHSLQQGEPVVEAAGSYYTPAIGSATTAGLEGATYYAVFADAEINTDAEYYKLVDLVNKGFQAYVAYILRLNSGTSLTLQATDARYQSLGTTQYPFVGSFDGSGRDIEIRSSVSDYATVPLFGVIGGTSEVSNFTYTVEPTVRYRQGIVYQGESVVGAFAHVNLGVVRNVTVRMQSGIYGDASYDNGYATYAGGMVGYNAGRIVNGVVSLNTGNVGGVNMAARIFGLYAGGMVGYNATGGWVGSEALSSVSFVLNTDILPASVVGIRGAGALVGLNQGTIANATATVRGIVGAPLISDSKWIMGARQGAAYDDYLVPTTDDVVSVGGIAGVNRGRIYGTRANVTSTAVLRAKDGYLGGIAGINETGTIGDSDVDDSIKVYWQRTVGADHPAYWGGVVAYSTGSLQGATVSVEANVAASGYVGGVVGRNAGYVNTVNLSVMKNVRLSSTLASGYVGGIAGYDSGSMVHCAAIVNGYLGSAVSGYVGGFVGYSAGAVRNSYVILYNTIESATAQGLATAATAGEYIDGEPKAYGDNAWAVAFNSDRTLASTSPDSGFNVLKIVAPEMVSPTMVKYTTRTALRFTSNITSGLVWYTDISTLQKDTSSSTVFAPDQGLHDCLYHLCAYDLEIDNVTDLANLYTFVNSADLFNGVMFKLINDITVGYGTNLQPIGSNAYPFTGIFEGDGHTVTFQSGSIVVGSDYSGLFGRIAAGAVVRNFVMQVDEGVLIGSTTNYVGALAGRIDGRVEGVAINAVSAPHSSKEGASVGTLAGYIGATATFDNVWAVGYNSTVDAAAGEDHSAGAYNVLMVYGSGIMRVVRMDGDWTNRGVMQFDIYVVDGLEYFDNWYSSFANSTVFNTASGYGDVRGDTVGAAYFRPRTDLHYNRFTVSFIKMLITGEQDFYNFAANINTYGVQTGQFRFDLGRNVTSLTIDLSKMQPIGTAAHPFQATLDGSVTSFSNPDTHAYTLVLKGAVQDADYSGLFGYIGEGATIRNLVVRADNANAQSIGYRESIYTGFFAAYIQGSAANPVTLENVVVGVGKNTTLINSHQDAIGGMAGLWGNHIDVRNSWVILPENGAYNALGSSRTAAGIQQFTETLAETYALALPNTMYLCGDGLISYTHRRTGVVGGKVVCNIGFELTSSDKYPLGFIEKSQMDMQAATLSRTMTATLEDGYVSKVYLALYVKTTVESEQDLLNIARMVNVENRSYLGVTFTMMNDITLSGAEWTPIGGAVETSVGSGEYRQVAFIGAFDGNGYTITMPEGMTCQAQYAGLFGILSDSARISNLRLTTKAVIGSGATQYAGVLAGIDQGAALSNIIVDIAQEAALNANMSTSRVAVNRALTYDVNGNVTNYSDVNKAHNVWVLNRNSRYSAEQNEAEQAFYDTVEDEWSGTFNGGVNVVTVIANGTVDIAFVRTGAAITGVRLRNAAASNKPIKMWYTAPNGVVTAYDTLRDYDEDTHTYTYRNEYISDGSEQGLVLYASFLNEYISTVEDLIALSQDVAVGCDLYGLTFYLEEDVQISAAAIDAGFVSIGTATTPFSATFDGRAHSITLAADAVIEGNTAGIFGVLGEYGTIRNLKLDLKGTIGRADYTPREVEAGKVNSMYAGAIAVSYGTLDSVIIDATALTVRALQYGYAAASIAYDYINYYTNTWLVVNADNDLAFFGEIRGGTDSTVNVLRVVGMGRVASTLEAVGDNYYVRFANDEGYTQLIDGVEYSYTVRGWYSNFSEDNQLSQALNVTALNTGISAGDSGNYLAADDIFSSRFEVAIVSRIIVSEADLIAIARDVNVGGYTFENTTFTLGHDVVIESLDFEPIGSAGTAFMGTFQGAYNGSFYKIVMRRHSVSAIDGRSTDAGVALFGANQGIVENLIVELAVDIPTYNSVVGVIAQRNGGTIRNVLVRLYDFDIGQEQPVCVYGSTVGGIVGYNNGTLSNCVVYVGARSSLNATYSVGGLVGQNEGVVLGSTYDQFDAWKNNEVAYATLQPWYDTFESEVGSAITLSSVLLDGTVSVTNSTSGEMLYAGGAVGESRNRATINRVTVRIAAGGKVVASGRNVEVGGLAGRSLATLANSVVMSEGSVSYSGTPALAYVGYFIGNLQGSAPNCWLVVPVPPTVESIGNGSSVNVLQINGNGFIDTYIDASNNIIFRDVTPSTGAALDGWYVNSGIQVPDDVGGVDGTSFRPNSTITGYTVNVVFINTQISTVDDLLSMAKTVNAGLFSTGLTFTLMNDLVVDVASSPLFYDVTIGTKTGEQHAFKHVFEGNDYTIRVVNSNNSVYGGAYVGLFGYTGQDAVIRNLTLVVESGTYGVAGTTQVYGTLVGENNGTIVNCKVYLGCVPTATGAAVSELPMRAIATKVGGVAGENFGSISNCDVISYAALQAETSGANQYVGGVVGNNRGTVGNVNIVLNQPLGGYRSMFAVRGDGTSYVGGVAGNNAIDISNVYIELNGITIESHSAVQAYAGGVCGSNTGFIKNSYVAWNDSVIAADHSAGGVVGTNNNNLASILVDYAEGSRVNAGADSAVANTGNYGAALNVWVYNRNDALNSKNANINNITEGNAALRHNDYAEVVREGRIYFDATIRATAGLAVYADATTAYKEVRFDDFIAYNGNTLRLNTYSNMVGVSVRSEIRNTIGDQTELKAIARALKENGQLIRDTYTLVDDIVVDGDYTAMGTAAGQAFGATLVGDMHSITFSADVHFTNEHALFGVLSGTVNGVVLRYNVKMNDDGAAAIAVTNNGAVRDIVIYAGEGVTLRHPTYASGRPSAANGQVWIVTAESIAASSVSAENRYGVITINGNGTLEVRREGGTLLFTAKALGNVTTFAGYSNVNVMRNNVGNETDRTQFNVVTAVSNNDTMAYTAEFLSTEIADDNDFDVLLNLLKKGYVAAATTYYLVDDIAVEAEDLKNITTFNGVLDGNFHTLKVLGDVDGAFARFSSVLQNLVLDATDLQGEKYLFENSATARLSRVAVRRNGVYGYIANPSLSHLTYEYVYIVSSESTCSHNEGVGLIVENGPGISFGRNGNFMQAIADTEAASYFVGWYTPGAQSPISRTTTLNLSHGTSYTVRYLAATISSAEDLTGLAQAVAAGYTFNGDVFTLAADIEYAGAAVGNSSTSFGGVFEGNGHSVSLSGYLFNRFAGEVRNVIFRTGNPAGFANGLGGTAQNVVVVCTAAGARFATDMACRLNDCWLMVSSATEPAANIKVVEVGDHVNVTPKANGSVYFDAMATGSEYFLLWCDKEGNVLYNEAYDRLTAAGLAGNYFVVSAVDEISTASQYAYFALATAKGFDSQVTLAADITIDSTAGTLTRSFKLDGDGHTITVASPMIFSQLTADSENSHIYNLVLRLADNVADFVLGREGSGVSYRTDMANVAIMAPADCTVQMAGDYDNVWLMPHGAMCTMESLATRYESLATGVNVMYYDKGQLSVAFLREGADITAMQALAAETDELYFLGYYDDANHADVAYTLSGSGKRVQAFFANKTLTTAAQWTHAAIAMDLTGTHGYAFTLGADIVAGADFVPFSQFAGVLNGAFYSVLVREGASLLDTTAGAGIVSLVAGATVKDLAVEIDRNASGLVNQWFAHDATATVDNVWIVNYTEGALSHAAGVRLMTVQDQGEGAGTIRVDKNGDAFAFVSMDTDVYSLRFYEMGGEDYDVDDAGKTAIVFAADETRDVVAKFYYCYTVYVEVDGVPQELVKAANLTPDTPYWLGFGYSNPKVEFKSVVQGYMFAGFSYPAEAAAAIDVANSTFTSLAIDVAALSTTGSITITAKFVLIETDWSELVYGDMTLAEIDQYLTPNQAIMDIFAADGNFVYDRYDTPDSNVLVDTDTPYHTGGYIIRYNVYYWLDATRSDLSKRVLVGRSDGLTFQITPRRLYFETLRVSTKKYDNTAIAKIESAELGGFAAEDVAKGARRQYSMAGIRLEYFDMASGEAVSNAGTWYLRVGEGSYIASTVLNSSVLYNDDYVLPTGALFIYAETENGFVKTDNYYTATINKQELDLVVSDVSIFYLDQFGSRDADGKLVPFDIYKYLNFEWSGTVYGDDNFTLNDNTQKAKLLRVAGDTTVVDNTGVTYSYNIRYPGSYSIEVIKDVLVNYEPKISENKATFTIKPSEAGVVLKDMYLQYGDTLGALEYSVVTTEGSVFAFSEEERQLLAASRIYTNLDAEDWFSMTLVPEYAIVDGNNVAFGVAPIRLDNEGNPIKAGVQYRFVAANRSFTLVDANAQMVINENNQREYVLRADGVLTVTKRQITYNVTADTSKSFGAEDGAISGRSVGKTLMNGDKLRFSRAAGELVGEYAISASVVDVNGRDVSGNYELIPYNGTAFVYTIVKRVVTVQRTGNGVFAYGSSDLQSMPYATNLSDSVKARIMSALGVNQRFDQAFTLRVGVTSTTQSVGKYNNADLRVNMSNRVNAALAEQCLEFRLDDKSKSYEIIRASLTVKAIDTERDYDMTDNLSGVGVEVTGWANNDEARIGVRVGRYICDGFAADAGTYYYAPSSDPADLTLYVISGSEELLANYVIGNVIGAKYVIDRIVVALDVEGGYYDEDGNFTADEDNRIPFGDKSAAWYFSLDEDEGELPAYMAEAYENAEFDNDRARSQWLQEHLSIVARSIASLPAGTTVSKEARADYYAPYSADSNISLDISASFRIEDIAIVITDVQFVADSAKVEPTVNFKVSAYTEFTRNEDGTITITGQPLEGYFDSDEVLAVHSGQRVNLNDNYAVTFNFSAYDTESCTYNLSSYVNDGTSWVSYRENGKNAILYVSQVDEYGDNVLVSYNRTLSDGVTLKDNIWVVLATAIKEHPVYLAVALAVVVALVVAAVLASVFYAKRRMMGKVKREMRNQAIVDGLQQQQSSGDATTDGSTDSIE